MPRPVAPEPPLKQTWLLCAIATMVAEARAVLGQEPIPAQAPDPLAEARRVLAELTSVIDRADRARQDLLAVIELAVEPPGSLL